MKKSSMIAMLALAALFSASVVKAADLPPPKKEICKADFSVTQLPSIEISITAISMDCLAFADGITSSFACFIPEPVTVEDFPITTLHGRNVDSCFRAEILKTSGKLGAKIGEPTIRKL